MTAMLPHINQPAPHSWTAWFAQASLSRHGFIPRRSAFIAKEHVEELMGSDMVQRSHRTIPDWLILVDGFTMNRLSIQSS